MELSYLLAPATVLLLCILEVNNGETQKTLGKNSGYASQIKYVSFDDPEITPEDDPLEKIYHITEISFDINRLSNRIKYQYTGAFAQEAI